MESFGDRLKDALERRGWNQGQLAKRILVSQPAVSQFITGRKAPSAKVLSDIANALDVDLGWLLNGAPSRRYSAPLRSSPDDLSWHERRSYGDGTQSYGNERVEVLDTTLPVLGRETGQNSNDAATGRDVTIEYRLGVLTGSRLDRFKEALQWDVLEPHYRAVAADRKHRTTQRYRDGLALLEKSQNLWVLRIDDYGTTGLTGDEFGEGCFSALVRRSQDSQKKSASSGGRFGLGAGVLSAVSAFDLVLFASNLAAPVDAKTDGRFIGRAFFPYHEINGMEYEGPFFLGIPGPESDLKRLSAWASPQFLDDLWMDRRNDSESSTGTSVLLVGFFDPDQGIHFEQDAELALDTLADEFVNFFWPAISSGQLSVIFSRYENDRLIQERTVDSTNLEHPFAALLDGSAAIIEKPVSLHIPKSRDSGDGPYDHTARLLVEILPDEAIGAKRVNEVAYCRRPLMVVKYQTMPHLTLGAQPFRAIVLAGEAASTDATRSVSDTAAEYFLSKAEPAQHDDWTASGTDLVAEYWGGKKAINDFVDSVRSELRTLVSPRHDRDDEGPRQLRELLALPGPGATPALRAYVSRLEWLDDRRERLSATIRLTARNENRYTLAPILTAVTETGSGLPVPITTSANGGCEVLSDGTVRPFATARDLILILEPLWTELPIRADLTALSLDVGLAERAGV